jgi:hypothetical protein
MYFEASELDRLSVGSVESFMLDVLDKAETQHGKPLSVFATHKDHAFAVSEDRVLRIDWSKTAGGSLDVKLTDSGVEPQTNANSESRALTRILRGAVQEMLDPRREPSRKRLRALCGNLTEDGACWLSDCMNWAQSKGASTPWLDTIELDEAAISSVENRDDLTRGIPRTPYSRIPADRLVEFESELRESLEKMIELVAPLERLAMIDDNQAPIRTRLAEEASGWGLQTERALELAESDDTGNLAQYHDLFATQLRRMLVMRAYIEPNGATA